MQESDCLEWGFRIDQYVSWNLKNEELALDVIWENLKNSVNPYLMRSEQDLYLLTSFRQGKRSVDEWHNTVQTQVALAKYPQELPRFCIEIYFVFS